VSLQALRRRWKFERAGQGFLNPIYFSVGARWITWLIALGIVLFQAAPPANLEHAWLLLLLTALQLGLMSLYLPFLRPRLGNATGYTENNPLLPALDILASTAVIWLSGGWRSPFYEYSLTSVLAPSLKYGLRGGTFASLGYSLCFLAAVAYSRPGMAAVYNSDGRLDGGFVGALLNPFLVAFFAAFLAELLRRLEREKARVRDLAAREERSRLGREIHDGVAQTMFMLTLSLDACRELASRAEQTALEEKLSQLLPVARQALWEVRNAMYDKAALLEGETPFSEALARLVREFESVSGIPVELKVDGKEPTLPVAQRVALYRVIQEALANAFKHSGSLRIGLQLTFTPGETCLCVEDKGRGFDPSTVRPGHGLGNMRTRIEELQGQLSLVSAPGEGTRVQVSLPGG
jgi:signal transduction histidine kinase